MKRAAGDNARVDSTLAPTVDPDLLARLQAVLGERPEVLESYLFGSAARGEAQPHSDLDIAVYLDATTPTASPFGTAAELTSALMAALGSNRVDLVLLNQAGPLLYGRVLRDGIRLTSRDLVATTRREGQALSRYCDFLPQLAKIEAAHRERVRHGELGR